MLGVCVAWRIAIVGRSTAAAIKRTTTIFFEAIHPQEENSGHGTRDKVEPCLRDALTTASVEAPNLLGDGI